MKLDTTAKTYIEHRIATVNPTRKKLISELKEMGYKISKYTLTRFFDKNHIVKPNKGNRNMRMPSPKPKHLTISTLLNNMLITESELFALSENSINARLGVLIKYYYNKNNCFTKFFETHPHVNLTSTDIYNKMLLFTTHLAGRVTH